MRLTLPRCTIGGQTDSTNACAKQLCGAQINNNASKLIQRSDDNIMERNLA
jgi:hypothetical protein